MNYPVSGLRLRSGYNSIMLKKTLLSVSILFSLIPFSSHAHLDGGVDVTVSEYLVDIGWSPEELQAGEMSTFSVGLAGRSDFEVREFDTVLVRIDDSTGETVQSMQLAQKLTGSTTFTTSLGSGEHKALVRFEQEGETLAETVVAIPVAESTVVADEQKKERSKIAQDLDRWYSTADITTFGLIILWATIWKGLALWRAARLQSKGWFIALFIINTMGILEIIYLIATRQKKDTERTRIS